MQAPSNSACGAAYEADAPLISYVNLSCGSQTDASIFTSVAFASFGTPVGNCSSGWTLGACNAVSSVSTVSAACVGKSSCAIPVTDSVFGDPCPGTKKELAVSLVCDRDPVPPTQTFFLNVSVPVGSTALIAVPLLTGIAASNATVAESGAIVWSNGTYISDASPGVLGGALLPGPFDGGRSPIPAIGFRVAGGGAYSFVAYAGA